MSRLLLLLFDALGFLHCYLDIHKWRRDDSENRTCIICRRREVREENVGIADWHIEPRPRWVEYKEYHHKRKLLSSGNQINLNPYIHHW